MSSIQSAAVSYGPSRPSQPQLTQQQYQQLMQQQHMQQMALQQPQPQYPQAVAGGPSAAASSLSIKGTVVITVLFAVISNPVVQRALAGVLANYVTMFDDAERLTTAGVGVTCALFLAALYVISKGMGEWLK